MQLCVCMCVVGWVCAGVCMHVCIILIVQLTTNLHCLGLNLHSICMCALVGQHAQIACCLHGVQVTFRLEFFCIQYVQVFVKVVTPCSSGPAFNCRLQLDSEVASCALELYQLTYRGNQLAIFGTTSELNLVGFVQACGQACICNISSSFHAGSNSQLYGIVWCINNITIYSWKQSTLY